MSGDCSEFYRRRDRRTSEYVERPGYARAHIGVFIGEDAASTEAGQVLTLALANQLARVHRTITFRLPGGPADLVAWSPFAAGRDFKEALLTTCRRIDPCGQFETDDDLTPEGVDVAIGVGERLIGCDWHVGSEGAIGTLAEEPCPVRSGRRVDRLGAAAASCLGAAAAFRTSVGMEVRPRRLSAWNCRESDAAAPGPGDLPPVDVGNVLMIGAGAVGSALAYWLRVMEMSGTWTVVDRDAVKVHNTNRSLLFTPRDAGWPVGPSRSKAKLVKAHLTPSSRAKVAWYDESGVGDERFDVVLCLANERDVRTMVARRNQAVVLHATTGRDWMSQLHRHVAAVDDCIRCRMDDVRGARFDCSEAPVPEEGGRAEDDAALPFLSASSGLMLCGALHRLQAGALVEDNWNDWRWHFDGARRMAHGGRRTCRQGCKTLQSPAYREAVNRGTRWAYLDPGVEIKQRGG